MGYNILRCCCWLVNATALLILICNSATALAAATDENQSSHRYLPNGNSERMQQIMKGVGPGEISWPQRTKPEHIDVKAEIAKLNTTYIHQSAWPANNVKLGSVSAVSFEKAGNVVIFHRCDHVWDQNTFNISNHYQNTYKGPIKDNTILVLDHNSGEVIYAWGKNMFYMPHGLTIDPEENVWVTDVALHQVFKFGPRGGKSYKPLLTLGTAFSPGPGETKFCKPTSVAVLENGDFFVADGYCNARILKYTKAGELILKWGQNSFSGYSYDVAPQNYFAIPHALTLVPEQQLVCVADRENGRVQCFHTLNGTFHSQYHSQIIGDRLFSMAYTPAEGGEFVIVNGPTAEVGIKPDAYNEVHGYIMNMRSKQVVSKFGPNNLQFANPHDVAVSADGMEIYVAELNPTRIHKFLHKSMAKTMTLSAAKPIVTISSGGADIEVNGGSTIPNQTTDESTSAAATTVKRNRPGATAILVSSLMLLFAFLTCVLSLIVARRRKRGCMPFGSQNRRHAWDKPEGFKLGGLLLDRSKRGGFEKLDQNASDEEPETPLNNKDIVLNNAAQFA